MRAWTAALRDEGAEEGRKEAARLSRRRPPVTRTVLWDVRRMAVEAWEAEAAEEYGVGPQGGGR